jgi:UDP-glucose 4-epimerase
MGEKRVVLVTGVAGDWGGRVAAQLIERPDLHVMGLDADIPKEEIKGLDFVQADIRNPLLVELLKDEKVDTLCHLAFVESIRSNEAAFDLNVIGTMKVLGACAEANVRKVVLRSSTLVYGAHSTNSAFLRENHALQGSRNYGYIRDMVEIEAFCNGFRGQSPHVLLTILRFAHIVGPRAETPMTRFLRDEETPVLLGFDPRMQVIHEVDVSHALVHAVTHDAPGVFNVAADGVMPLIRLTGLAGKLPMPVLHPMAYLGVSLLGPHYAPIDLDYLRYPCVADLQKMHTELEFVPQYTAEEALREFAAQQRIRQYLPESAALAYDQERLRDTLERRRRAQAQLMPATPMTAQPRRRANGKRASKPASSRRRVRREAEPVDPLIATGNEGNDNG